MDYRSIYEPLSGLRAIRLLRLKPAEYDEEIECTLEIYDSLEAAPDFEAVSYCWGSPVPPATVLCNGISVQVTQNLRDALLALRPRPPFRSDTTVIAKSRAARDVTGLSISDGLLWVDALVINQGDVQERGNQVSMMGEIFKRARSVIIWLGREDSFITEAAPILKRLSDLGAVNRKMRSGTVYGYWNRSTAALAEKGFPSRESEYWRPLRQFFMIPWFTRLWVLQEFALAGQVRMYVGHYQLNPDILERAVSNFSRFGFFDVLNDEEQSAFWAIDDMFRRDHIWRIRTGKAPRSLWDLLPRCIWFHCLDPRDRIFALLSMSSEGASGSHGTPELVAPNYHKSPIEVFRDASLYCLTTTRKLQCLGYATAGPDEEKSCSWAMNLDRNLVLTQVSWGNSAAYDSCAIIEPSDDPAMIRLHGMDVAKVKLVSTAIPDPKQHEKSKFEILHAFIDQVVSSNVESHMEAMSITRALVQALTAGWLPFLRRLASEEVRDPEPLINEVSQYLLGRTNSLPADVTDDVDHLLWWSRMRRFFVTADGRFGLGPPSLQSGDEVKCLLGAPVLHVLRPSGEYYRYVGDCAMHGLMQGQLIRDIVGGKRRQDLPPTGEEETCSSTEEKLRMRLSSNLKELNCTTVYAIR